MGLTSFATALAADRGPMQPVNPSGQIDGTQQRFAAQKPYPAGDVEEKWKALRREARRLDRRSKPDLRRPSTAARCPQYLSVQPLDASSVSNVRPSPCSHRCSISAVWSSPWFRNAHSQTIATRHPDSSRWLRLRLSRLTLSWNFACQNSSRVAGVVVYGHPM